MGLEHTRECHNCLKDFDYSEQHIGDIWYELTHNINMGSYLNEKLIVFCGRPCLINYVNNTP